MSYGQDLEYVFEGCNKMKIELIDNLLHASLTITYKGKTKVIDNMVVDTGTAYTLISSDAVDDLGIFVEPGDEIIGMIGNWR